MQCRSVHFPLRLALCPWTDLLCCKSAKSQPERIPEPASRGVNGAALSGSFSSRQHAHGSQEFSENFVENQGDGKVPVPHSQQARQRRAAIEKRRPVVKVTTTGVVVL